MECIISATYSPKAVAHRNTKKGKHMKPTTTKTIEDLMIEQIILERNSRDLGILRNERTNTRHTERGTEADSDYGRKLIQQKTTEVSKGIAKFCTKANSGRPGRKSTAVNYLNQIQPDHAAVLAIRGILNGITRPRTLTAVANEVGGLIEDELRMRSVEQQDPRMAARMTKMMEERQDYHFKRTLMVQISNLEDIRWDTWPKDDKIRVGITLIDIVIETIGLIQLEQHTTRKNQTPYMVILREDAREMIEQAVANGGLLTPVYEPMIIPPKPWTSPYNGAYYSNYIRKPKLVKSRARGYHKFLKTHAMGDVYAAVNTAQQTAYRVDPYMVTIMGSIFNANHSEAGLPHRSDKEEPIAPDYETMTDAQKKDHRLKRFAIRQHNTENKSKRISFLQGLDTAKKFQQYDEIYFPMCLDFRGRLYAIPSFNVQGPDWMKACIRFKDAGPIGPEGADMLAIHVANTGDFEKVSKKSHAERIQWVQNHEAMIRSIVSDPLGDKRWHDADYPFQFLTACRDWVGFLDEGMSFVSTVICAFDGTCSGLQHYSAMFRDEIGGAEVNLIPTAQPQDIYKSVAQKLVNTLYDEQDTTAHARLWLKVGVDRTTTKRGVMTLGYGSRSFGFSEQLQEDILKNIEGIDPTVKPYAAAYLAKRLYAAASETVVKAVEGMEWVRAVARHVTKNGSSVKWVTPDGFPVVQSYAVEYGKLINFKIAGKRVRLMVVEEEHRVMNRNAQVTGAPPNFVHSYDGYHLRNTILKASEGGVRNFALVHDSFGTSADQAGALYRNIRTSFVDCYTQHDPITDFYNKAFNHLPTEKAKASRPHPPKSGTMDITKGRDYMYSFS